MTEQEFLRYKGLKTNGSHGGHNFEGGIVVGYRKNYKPTDFQSFIAFFNDDRGWYKIDITERVDLDDRPNGTFLYVSLDNLVIETENEEKELDLTEILEGCEGVELWSDICGICKLKKIHYDYSRPIGIKSKYSKHLFLMKDGKYYTEGKCMLWPSETNRDWSTFKKPVKVNDDDWVACFESIENGFVVCRYGKLITDWKYIIPYDKFNLNLQEEDLKKLSIV